MELLFLTCRTQDPDMKRWSCIFLMAVLGAILNSCASDQPASGTTTNATGQHGPVTVDPTPPSAGMMRGRM